MGTNVLVGEGLWVSDTTPQARPGVPGALCGWGEINLLMPPCRPRYPLLLPCRDSHPVSLWLLATCFGDIRSELLSPGLNSRKFTQKSVDNFSPFSSTSMCKPRFMLSLSFTKKRTETYAFFHAFLSSHDSSGKCDLFTSFRDKWQWLRLHLCQPLSKWFQVVFLEGLFHLPQHMRQLWGSVELARSKTTEH